MATEAFLGHAIRMHFTSKSDAGRNIALNMRTRSAIRRLLPQVRKLLGLLATGDFPVFSRWGKVRDMHLLCCGLGKQGKSCGCL